MRMDEFTKVAEEEMSSEEMDRRVSERIRLRTHSAWLLGVLGVIWGCLLFELLHEVWWAPVDRGSPTVSPYNGLLLCSLITGILFMRLVYIDLMDDPIEIHFVPPESPSEP